MTTVRLTQKGADGINRIKRAERELVDAASTERPKDAAASIAWTSRLLSAAREYLDAMKIFEH